MTMTTSMMLKRDGRSWVDKQRQLPAAAPVLRAAFGDAAGGRRKAGLLTGHGRLRHEAARLMPRAAAAAADGNWGLQTMTSYSYTHNGPPRKNGPTQDAYSFLFFSRESAVLREGHKIPRA